MPSAVGFARDRALQDPLVAGGGKVGGTKDMKGGGTELTHVAVDVEGGPSSSSNAGGDGRTQSQDGQDSDTTSESTANGVGVIGTLRSLREMDRMDWLRLLMTHGLRAGGFLILPWVIIAFFGFELIPILCAMLLLSFGYTNGEYQRYVLRQLELSVAKLKGQVKKLGEENDRFEESNEVFAKSNEDLKANNEALSANNEKLAETNEKLSENTAKFTKENAKLSAERERMAKENEKFLAENEKYAKENAKYLENNAAMAKQNEKLAQNVADLESTKNEMVESVGRLKKENETLSSEIAKFTGEVDRLGDTSKQLEKQVDFLKNVNKTISNNLVECTTPELVNAFQAKMEEAMSSEGTFGKMMLPFEKTQKKYEEVLKQLTELTERQEHMAEEEMERNRQQEQRQAEHERRERKLQKHLESVLKQQEGYQDYAKLLDYAEDVALPGKRGSGGTELGGFLGRNDEKKIVKKFKDLLVEHLNTPPARLSSPSEPSPSREEEREDLTRQARNTLTETASALERETIERFRTKFGAHLLGTSSPLPQPVQLGDLTLKNLKTTMASTNAMERIDLWKPVFLGWREYVKLEQAIRRKSVSHIAVAAQQLQPPPTLSSISSTSNSSKEQTAAPAGEGGRRTPVNLTTIEEGRNGPRGRDVNLSASGVSLSYTGTSSYVSGSSYTGSSYTSGSSYTGSSYTSGSSYTGSSSASASYSGSSYTGGSASSSSSVLSRTQQSSVVAGAAAGADAGVVPAPADDGDRELTESMLLSQNASGEDAHNVSHDAIGETKKSLPTPTDSAVSSNLSAKGAATEQGSSRHHRRGTRDHKSDREKDEPGAHKSDRSDWDREHRRRKHKHKKSEAGEADADDGKGGGSDNEEITGATGDDSMMKTGGTEKSRRKHHRQTHRSKKSEVGGDGKDAPEGQHQEKEIDSDVETHSPKVRKKHHRRHHSSDEDGKDQKDKERKSHRSDRHERHKRKKREKADADVSVSMTETEEEETKAETVAAKSGTISLQNA